MNRWRVVCVAAVCGTVVMVGQSDAGERRFTYLYEATTHAKGEWEFEQWVTWKTSKENDRDFDRFDFRTELEYGVTDSFQLGIYLSDWRYESNVPEGENHGKWRNAALEGIWNLSNPTTDPIGVALYAEVEVGDELFELEGKLILQKNFGKFTLAYNAVIEAEWEGAHYEVDNGELEQTLGMSYQFSPRFLAGFELLHEVSIPDWAGARGKGVLYMGPNFSYRTKSWWATLTPLFQVSDVEDEPDFQMRLIVGFPFGG
jgi:hypothetical protein